MVAENMLMLCLHRHEEEFTNVSGSLPATMTIKLPMVETSRATRCESATTTRGTMTKGTQAFVGECVTLTEVKFDGIVCGIEVAPYIFGENETVSTTPITSYPSGSWSLSSHSVGEVEPETNKPLRPLDVAVESPLEINTTIVHSYSNGVCSPVYELESTRKRARSRVGQRVHSEELQVLGPIVFDSEDEYNENDGERNHAEASRQTMGSTLLLPAVTVPRRDLMFNQMFPPKLTQPWNTPTKMLDKAPPKILPTVPAILHNNDSTQPQLTPSSTSPLLSAVHGKDQIRLTLETFRHMVPKLLSSENSPGALRVQLDNWRDNMRSLKQRMKDVATEPLMISCTDGITCSASALPLISTASPQPSTASDPSLFQDQELNAIMALTEGGADTSILFPCVSDESRSEEDFEDDDGLRDELGALNTIEEDLRKELEATDILLRTIVSSISGSDTDSAPTSVEGDEEGTKAEVNPLGGEADYCKGSGGECKSLLPQGTKSTECDSSIEPEELDGEEKYLEATEEVVENSRELSENDSLLNETRGPERCSVTSPEDNRKEWEALEILQSLEEAKSSSIEGSTDSVILYKATRSLDSLTAFDSEVSSYAESRDSFRPVSILRSTGKYSRPATRVRFKEQLEEFFSYDESFEGDYTACPDSPSCQDARGTDLGDLQGAWEDFYFVCEELIDEVLLACCKATDRRSYPSNQQMRSGPVKRSSLHYF